MLRDSVPVGQIWQYEIKHDGSRIQAHAIEGGVRLFSKSGRDYTDRLPAIRDATASLGRDVILDGEAVMLGAGGVGRFFALAAAIAAGHAPEAVYIAFDILRLDGEDLRERPLAERRALLAEMMIGSGYALSLSDHHVGEGPEMLRPACAMGLEGIVAKRRDRPYRSGARDEWVKVKCTKVEAFGVIGFDPAGKRGVASLKLATVRDETLVPVRIGWLTGTERLPPASSGPRWTPAATSSSMSSTAASLRPASCNMRCSRDGIRRRESASGRVRLTRSPAL